MSGLKKLWRVLEAVPGLAAVEAEWRAQLGSEYESTRTFFRPNGKIASSFPCTVPNGCGCDHEVIVHGPEDIVAVCQCERGCETFPLKRPDIVVYELDRSVFDTAIADAFGLFKEIDARTDLHGTTRIGVYSPYAGFRFPVYLTIQLEPDEFENAADSLLGRYDTPFMLMAPTRDLCTTQVEQRLTGRQSIFVPLSESVAIGAKQQFQLLRPLDDVLSQFRAANLPAARDDSSTVFFPTPPDAAWGDVSIRFKDGHTVSVRVNSVTGVFNYTQMGMANAKNGNPTVQWELLQTFAEQQGTLDWSSPKADRKNQKRREKLAENLRQFFRIDGDPIELAEDGKGWRVLFSLHPES